MALDPTQALPLLRALSSSVNIRAIYPPDHPKVHQGVDLLVEALETCLRERNQEEITLLVIDQELLVDDRPIRTRTLHLAPLIRVLSAHGIERMTFGFGLDAEEGHRLVEGLAGGKTLSGYEHIVLGRVQLGEVGEGGSPTSKIGSFADLSI